jgi:outer membrane protein OmpA-like peptidoglycan-associated protein
VTLSNVLFETDRAELIAGAAPTVDQLAGFLQRNPDYVVVV